MALRFLLTEEGEVWGVEGVIGGRSGVVNAVSFLVGDGVRVLRREGLEDLRSPAPSS